MATKPKKPVRTKFTRKQPGSPELQSTVKMVNEDLKADPVTRYSTRIAIVPKPPSNKEEEAQYTALNGEEYDDERPMNDALEDLNKMRQQNGLSPLKWVRAFGTWDLSGSAAFHHLTAYGKEHHDGQSFLSKREVRNAGGIVNMPEKSESYLDSSAYPLTRSAKYLYKKSSGASDFTAYHEAMHSFGGEKIADVGAVMMMYRKGDPEIRSKTFAIAMFRELENLEGGSSESKANDHHTPDSLLRARADIIADKNKSLQGSLKKKTISQVAEYGAEKYVKPDQAMETEAEYQHHQGIVQLAKGWIDNEHRPARNRLPAHLTVAEAVDLYRKAYAVEHYTTKGKKNGLSEMMPKLEQQFPGVFEEARNYMARNYKWEVKPYSPERKNDATLYQSTHRKTSASMTPAV